MKNIKLLIIFIILAGLAYIASGPYKNWRENRSVPKNFLAGIEISQADKVEVTRAEKTEVLAKEGERWKTSDEGDFYASDRAIQSMENAFRRTAEAKLEIVSANQSKKADFDLSDQYGTQVKIYKGENILADFMIGREAENYSGAYIGRAGDSNIYFVPVALTAAFGPVEWRDSRIFSFLPDKASRLRLQYPDREIILEKKDGKWAGTKPGAFAVNGQKAESILSSLSQLSAASIPAQSFAGTDLEKNLIIVEADGEEGNFTLMIGKDNGLGNFYAKRGDSDNIYLISKTDRDGFNKKVEDLK